MKKFNPLFSIDESLKGKGKIAPVHPICYNTMVQFPCATPKYEC